jgi:hypothetical protein
MILWGVSVNMMILWMWMMSPEERREVWIRNLIYIGIFYMGMFVRHYGESSTTALLAFVTGSFCYIGWKEFNS